MISDRRLISRHSSFLLDIGTVARRAVRSLSREPEFIGPALAIPIFFFMVIHGTLLVIFLLFQDSEMLPLAELRPLLVGDSFDSIS